MKSSWPWPTKAADPEDFSAVELEIDIGGSAGAKGLRLEDEIACRLRGVWRKQIPGVAADHQADKAGRIKSGKGTVGGDRTVLQNCHIVAEVENFIQPVRYVENRDAAVAQPTNESHQYRDVRRSERRRRFVQDEDARLDIERLGDLDDLASAEGQSPDGHVQRFDQPELLADLRDRARQASVVDEPALARIRAEADVFGDGKMRREAQLLLHDGDPKLMRLMRRQ